MATAKCTKCGAELLIQPGAASVTCSGCGTSFRLKTAAPEQAAASPPPPPPPASPQPPPPPVAEWYFIDASGQQQGPLTKMALDQRIRSGFISATTLVWKLGMAEWQAVQNTEFSLSLPPRSFVSGAEAPSVAGQQAQKVGKLAYDEMKRGMGSAAEAMKILLGDPMGGQGRCLNMLGEAKALQAGVVFSIAFVVVSYLLAKSALTLYMGMGDPFAGLNSSLGRGFPHVTRSVGLPLGIHLKLILVSCIPVVGLVGGFLGIGKIFGGRTNIQVSLFTTGVALLPITLAALIGWLLGTANIEMIAVVFVFCGFVTVSLLNASLMDVQKLSTRKVILLTPTLVLVAGYITKLLVSALLFR